MKRRHPEDDLQISCIQAFEWQYPTLKDLLIHIPNGGKRNAFEAKRLKTMGVRPGVSDLLLAVPTEKYHGLWLELKAEKNKMTPSQAEFFRKMDLLGYKTVEVRSIEAFMNETKKYIGDQDRHEKICKILNEDTP